MKLVSTPAALLLVALFFVVLLLQDISPARAYVLDPGSPYCVGNSQWSVPSTGYRDVPVYWPCSFPLNWTNNTTGFTKPTLRAAAIRSFKRWHQDGLSRLRFSWQMTSCSSGNTIPNDGSWYGDTEELSEVWFSTEANFNFGPTYAGVEITDRESCFWWGDNEYLATDIDIIDLSTAYGGWASPSTSSLALCLGSGVGSGTVEATMLHEAGHALGLEHDNSIITTMNETSKGRRCDLGAAWSQKPWPDESEAMMVMYGTSDWADFVDVTGSPSYGTYDAPEMTNRLVFACRSEGIVSENASGEFGFSHGNHFGNAGGTRFRYEIVPESYVGTNPNGNSVTSSSWYSNTIPASATQPGASWYLFNQTVTFNAASVPFGTYRVWVRLDPLTSNTEIDAADNTFPTMFRIQIMDC